MCVVFSVTIINFTKNLKSSVVVSVGQALWFLKAY